MNPDPSALRAQAIAALIVFLALVGLSASVGAHFTPGAWYESLNKPWWTPDKGVFTPVWTLLYLSIAIAAWLVWRRVGWRHLAMWVFIVQLLLNAAWSYLFFGLHRMDWAFYEIIALWLAVLAMVILFWRVRAAAGSMLIPYLLWVAFAAVLNLGIWRANSG